MKYDKIYIVAPVAQWIEQYRPKVMVEGLTSSGAPLYL